MSLDVIAYYESRAGTTTLSNVAGVADTHVTVSGDNITVPDLCNKILAALEYGEHGGAEYTSQVQISSPSLRATSLLDLGGIGPGTAGVSYPGNNAPIDTFENAPIPLVSGEALQVLESASGTSTAATNTVVFLTDGTLANPYALDANGKPARIETIYCTSATTVTAHAWSACTLTFGQQLRAGVYAVVGAKFAGATMGVGRLIFGNQGNRPGAPGCVSLRSYVDPAGGLFRYGRLGVWGLFTHTNPPQLEVLCGAADTAQYALLDIVKVG